MGGLEHHLAAEAHRAALRAQGLDRLGREAFGPAAATLLVQERQDEAREAVEKGRGLADLVPGLGGVDRIVAVRRADIELGSARHQHEAGLAHALAQLGPLVRGVGRVRHLDIVADDEVGAAAGDVAADAACQKRRVAMVQPATDRELVRGPLLAPVRDQVLGHRVPLDDPAHVAGELGRKRALGREHQDAQVRSRGPGARHSRGPPASTCRRRGIPSAGDACRRWSSCCPASPPSRCAGPACPGPATRSTCRRTAGR